MMTGRFGSIGWQVSPFRFERTLAPLALVPHSCALVYVRRTRLRVQSRSPFFPSLVQYLSQPVVVHFHRWQGGHSSLSEAAHRCHHPHATLLGRYLCAGSIDFYNHLQYFDVDHGAGKHGIYHRDCVGRSSAHCADVFTTVSHITAYEAKRASQWRVIEWSECCQVPSHARIPEPPLDGERKVNEFVRDHFYGHVDFDPDNTLYIFSTGRYDYRNKGLDMFTEALARLNYRLQFSSSVVTIVAFITTLAQTHSYTIDSLKGQAVTKQLKDTVKEIQNRIGSRLFDMAVQSNGYGFLRFKGS